MQSVRCVFFTLLIFCSSLFAEVKSSTNIKFYYDEDITSKEALKDLKSFLAFARFPANSPKEEHELKQIVIYELEKIGKVIQRSLLVKTPSGEVFDYTNFPNVDGTMILEISQLIDSQAKELPIVKVSAKILCQANLNKTHEMISSIVWSKAYFFSGSLRSNLRTLVSKCFEPLLKEFNEAYQIANNHSSEKISFYFING